MAKNKSNTNRHATADNQNNKVTCPYCNSTARNLNFEHSYGIDENGDLSELTGDKLYFCESCFNSFIDEPRGYQDGMIKGRRTKIGRNEKCPCGSGLKYKRCCGKNYQPIAEQQTNNDFIKF